MLAVSKERDVKHGAGFSEEPRSNRKPKIELGFSKQVTYIFLMFLEIFFCSNPAEKNSDCSFKETIGR